MRASVTILLIAVTACTAAHKRGSAREASSRANAEQNVREKKLRFEIATDGPCWVTGRYHDSRLERITISIGLSNARLDWILDLPDGQLRRFSAVRNYFAWDSQREEFQRGVIHHQRSVNYSFEGGKFTRHVPSDKADLADDKWTENQIAKMLAISKGYLESGRSDAFESRLEEFVK